MSPALRMAVFFAGPPAAVLAWVFFTAQGSDLVSGDAGRLVGAVGNLAALLAAPLLATQVLSGARNRLLARFFSPADLGRAHVRLGPVIAALLLLHAACKVYRFADLQGLDLGSAALAMPNTWEMLLGKAALVMLLVGAALALAGRRGLAARNIWKPPHLLLYAAAPMGLVHGLFRGETLSAWPALIVWGVCMALLVLAPIMRVFKR